MKFLRMRPFAGSTVDAAIRFLRIDLAKMFSDLVEGLKHLTFSDNFDHFIVDVTIGAGETLKIANRLQNRDLMWFPVRIIGDARLIDGDAFTNDWVYIKNASSTSTSAKILFLR